MTKTTAFGRSWFVSEPGFYEFEFVRCVGNWICRSGKKVPALPMELKPFVCSDSENNEPAVLPPKAKMASSATDVFEEVFMVFNLSGFFAISTPCYPRNSQERLSGKNWAKNQRK